eukprot:GHVU01181321.1.p1 GENE.GHVU01181321.1~~GHVU01181321.1.p1  ORF type:complete len:119 (+),score=9.91 GHVU01181321.1:481-837(+)
MRGREGLWRSGDGGPPYVSICAACSHSRPSLESLRGSCQRALILAKSPERRSSSLLDPSWLLLPPLLHCSPPIPGGVAVDVPRVPSRPRIPAAGRGGTAGRTAAAGAVIAAGKLLLLL